MSPWRNAAAPDGSSRTSAALDELGQPLVARERGDQLELERLARDGRDLGGRAGGLGELARADQHRVAHGVGERDVAVAGQLEPAPPGLRPRR